MGLRDRMQERRAENQGITVYQMRQKLLSIGDDFWIEDNHGNRCFKVNGKAVRVRDTMIFEDANGTELFKIQERMLRVRDTMEIENAGGSNAATVKKAMISPLRERWHVEVAGGSDIKVQGNIVDHEYTLEANGDKVAEVSKRWLRVADTYGVEVQPGQNAALVLAIVAVVDSMAHPDR
ncbi:MAG: LURP-one-related family protein [Candidatus Nanopelagicales bacterium]